MYGGGPPAQEDSAAVFARLFHHDQSRLGVVSI